VESEKQPSSALLAEQGASTSTITALQVVASLLGHVRLSTAQMFWECDTVQAQPGCMVCREILQRPLAGFMKYTPGKLFTIEQGARRKSRRIRKPARLVSLHVLLSRPLAGTTHQLPESRFVSKERIGKMPYQRPLPHPKHCVLAVFEQRF